MTLEQMLQATVKQVRTGLKDAPQPVTVEIETHINRDNGNLTKHDSSAACAQLKFTITIPAAS